MKTFKDKIVEADRKINEMREGYKIMPPIPSKYKERRGLEGPFRLDSGMIVYYDPKEGKYYNSDTDMYLSHKEYEQHHKP